MTKANRIVLFDGVCNLCNSSIQFTIKRDKKGLLSYASLQSEIGRDLLIEHQINPDILSSVVFIENGKAFKNSAAAIKIARHLGLPFNLLQAFLIVPHQIRDVIYNWIARNRYKWFGQSETCMLPDEEMMSRFLEYQE